MEVHRSSPMVGRLQAVGPAGRAGQGSGRVEAPSDTAPGTRPPSAGILTPAKALRTLIACFRPGW